MNKDRRKAIQEAVDAIDLLKGRIEELRDEEQEYFDNMPESLQGGDKGQAAEDAISQLDYAVDNLQEAIDNAQGALG